MLNFAVLGPVAAFDEDRPVELGGRLPRRLLALLLAADGHAVSEGRLAEGLWEGRAPGNPMAALQVHVSRLRRVLPGVELHRTGGGYRLLTTQTDVRTFARLTADAHALSAGGRPAEAHESLMAALGLWRGEPYEDGPLDHELEAARAALVELRESAREDSVAALLASGEHARAVARAESLVANAPYRERRWELLALALYRSGRQGEALAAVRRVRVLLADELGVDPGPELQVLERRMLQQDPALRAYDPPASPTHVVLPPRTGREGSLSSFVGRDQDLVLLDELVSQHRLVTVVGPAGAGKTRLVAEWARTPVVVRLADVTDPALLMSVLATSIGIPSQVGDLDDAVARQLGAPDALLVLDNCEHLDDDVARLVIALLERVPALRIVATSRAPVGVYGERILPLGPLTSDSAVTLLTDRIRAVRPGWSAGPQDHQDLHHLADALDRLPLALELAAARARTFGLRELTENVEDRFALLGRVPHGAMNPHATLREAIAWSIDQLSETERELAVRLWPYEGGFPLEAAGSDLGTLAALVDQSVVTATVGKTSPRYRMLETIRAFCRLVDQEPDSTRAAHAAWVRDLVARAARDLQDAGSPAAMARLHRELPNIRAALTYDLVHAPGEALRSATRLMWFWIRSGLLAEGRRVLTAALAAASQAPLDDVVRAQAALAGVLYTAGDGAAARQVLAEASRDAGQASPRARAEVRYYEALVQLPEGDVQVALSAATEANRLAVEAEVAWLVAATEMALGAALVLAGHLADGQIRLRAAAHKGVVCDHVWTAALSELMLGQIMLASGDKEALPLLRSSLRRFRGEDDVSNVLAVLHNGALALEAAGDRGGAATLHDVVHFHSSQGGMQPASAYIQMIMPMGRYEGEPPTDPPTLGDAIAVIEASAAAV